ncbi:outer membrane beta-barrel protein [Flammeovirga kamogawensis]|uniref:Porin family protein n=1 Tax=Flammeovirga kamogawensis TaxID=373891 RepID=A0ABX8H2N7_9BACT|nr:outer membrane beta-barrel protein [Flammeovirga kamogawensis]MBB6462597.1 outer membrane protein W [Flammeovirga kamogawensis]QWG09657.1 porin family protein [Flammeovirga kamogawensis]TRX65171.1 porin family protein [Flammeovirga kamogawensis]
MLNLFFKSFFVFVFIFMCTATTQAQKIDFIVNYSKTNSVGDVHQMSLNGVGIDIRKNFSKIPISIGVASSYNFSEKELTSEINSPIPDSDLKNFVIVPFQLNVHYNFNRRGIISPFIGFGGSGYFIEQGYMISHYALDPNGNNNVKEIKASSVSFGFIGEIGFTTSFFDRINPFFSLKYNYVPTNEFNINYSNISVNCGLSF